MKHSLRQNVSGLGTAGLLPKGRVFWRCQDLINFKTRLCARFDSAARCTSRRYLSVKTLSDPGLVPQSGGAHLFHFWQLHMFSLLLIIPEHSSPTFGLGFSPFASSSLPINVSFHPFLENNMQIYLARTKKVINIKVRNPLPFSSLRNLQY